MTNLSSIYTWSWKRKVRINIVLYWWNWSEYISLTSLWRFWSAYQSVGQTRRHQRRPRHADELWTPRGRRSNSPLDFLNIYVNTNSWPTMSAKRVALDPQHLEGGGIYILRHRPLSVLILHPPQSLALSTILLVLLPIHATSTNLLCLRPVHSIKDQDRN